LGKSRPRLYNDLKNTQQERIEADRLAVEAWLQKKKNKVKILKPDAALQSVDYLWGRKGFRP
jgi:hypothetical protein